MMQTGYLRAGSRGDLTPVVRTLLYANVGAFVLEILVAPPLRGHLIALLGLSVPGLRARAFWQLGTYMFLHAGTTHLFMNMLALYLIGPAVEQGLGRRRFITLYLLSGILGGIGFLLMDPRGICIGASGAVFGVFGAFVALYPRQRMVLIFLPFIQFEAWIFALVFIGIEMLYMVLRPEGNIAHSAHIAGAIAGFFFVRMLARNSGSRFSGSWLRLRGRQARPPIYPPYAGEIDRILDKVAEHGIGSLTRREREILDVSSRNRSPR